MHWKKEIYINLYIYRNPTNTLTNRSLLLLQNSTPPPSFFRSFLDHFIIKIHLDFHLKRPCRRRQQQLIGHPHKLFTASHHHHHHQDHHHCHLPSIASSHWCHPIYQFNFIMAYKLIWYKFDAAPYSLSLSLFHLLIIGHYRSSIIIHPSLIIAHRHGHWIVSPHHHWNTPTSRRKR